jgi:hypothetical protein
MWLKYNNLYDISDTGEVRNTKTKRVLKPSVRAGYFRIIIRDNDKVINKTLSIMVAERFLPKIDLPHLTVDHIDRDKNNNNASNIRWASRTVQALNRTMKIANSGLRHINYRTDNKNPRVVIVRENKTIYNKTFKTLEEAIVARNNYIMSI